MTELRAVWSGTVNGVDGFLRPDPPPPVIIGGFGPKMAELAGRVGDGINLPAGRRLPDLLEVAKDARLEAGRDWRSFVVTVSSDLSPASLQRLDSLDVKRAVVLARAPFGDTVRSHGSATILSSSTAFCKALPVDVQDEPVERISAVTLRTARMSEAVAFYQALGFPLLYGGRQARFASFRVGDGYLNLQGDAAEPRRESILGPRHLLGRRRGRHVPTCPGGRVHSRNVTGGCVLGRAILPYPRSRRPRTQLCPPPQSLVAGALLTER